MTSRKAAYAAALAVAVMCVAEYLYFYHAKAKAPAAPPADPWELVRPDSYTRPRDTP